MTTKHSHKPNFGRRVEGCPRCAELAAGAEPVRWANQQERSRTGGYPTDGEIRAHDCGVSRCGPVCTFGDW